MGDSVLHRGACFLASSPDVVCAVAITFRRIEDACVLASSPDAVLRGGNHFQAHRGCVPSCFFAGSRFRFGLLALPLCGAALTFFAAAKKVSKESSFCYARGHTQFG
ncbi:hypothetical protein [Caballeronia fortuita]|uniref:hypothetical protein n=1 Tax=Caballeronia fortuita TaxID=1777138 RepID=UPI0012FD2336|nr:hypothetical protein [Caballeronia fortuita]